MLIKRGNKRFGPVLRHALADQQPQDKTLFLLVEMVEGETAKGV